MYKKIVFLTTFLAIFLTNCQGQKKAYICMSDLSPHSIAALQKDGFGFARTLNSGNDIVKKGEFAVDSVKMVQHIEALFPIGCAFTIGILDWEEGLGTILETKTDSTTTAKIIGEYLKALRIAKQTRPNIRWGIYSLPATRFWNRDPKWYAQIHILDKVLAAVDVFCPSLYGYYPNMKVENAAYVKANLEYALQLGNEYHKPVYAFVWHRWHDSNPTEGLKVMPWDEMSIFIQTVADTKVNGTSAVGCIWWGEDHYFWNVNAKNMRNGLSKQQNFDQYHDAIIEDYGTRIKAVFSKK